MRNRQFQIRTARRQIIAEIAKGYYRPPEQPKLGNLPRTRKSLVITKVAQLTLDFSDTPLADIFPEAYK